MLEIDLYQTALGRARKEPLHLQLNRGEWLQGSPSRGRTAVRGHSGAEEVVSTSRQELPHFD